MNKKHLYFVCMLTSFCSFVRKGFLLTSSQISKWLELHFVPTERTKHKLLAQFTSEICSLLPIQDSLVKKQLTTTVDWTTDWKWRSRRIRGRVRVLLAVCSRSRNTGAINVNCWTQPTSQKQSCTRSLQNHHYSLYHSDHSNKKPLL